MFGVARRGGDFIMSMVSLLVRLAFMQSSGSMSFTQKLVHDQIPLRIEEVLKRFDLDGRTTTYAMCPSCHKRHTPHFKPGSRTPTYPEHCVNVIFDQGVCGEPLLDKDKPIKPFVYHHINDFIGSLLSKAETEAEIDQACHGLFEFIKSGKPAPHFVRDVFEAEFLRTFEGPKAGQLFVDRGPEKEARLVFSLNVDFFNVEGMRIRGARTSCGIISMVCLNLAPTKRFRPEYMALNIIPGPREPTGPQLNYYMEPIVDDMKALWEKGTFYRRTALFPEGRVARSAIICEVCDLPAGRKLSGLAASTSDHFCSICSLHGINKNVGRYDWKAWKERDIQEMRRLAEQWRDASSATEQQKLYELNGIAWSEMYRLSYYDPRRQLTVDPMHTVLSDAVEVHFRHILKLTSADAKAKPVESPAFAITFRKPFSPDHPDYDLEPQWKRLDDKERKQVDQIHCLLTSQIGESTSVPSLAVLTKRLVSKRKNAIMFVHDDICRRTASQDKIPGDDDLRKRKTKDSYAQDIGDWVRRLHYS